jgi:L-threonylcarbamoyladenylate synthase
MNVDKAARLLKAGEIVAFPTETVYGLGALLFDEKAVLKVFKAKKRPQNNPLIAHIATLEQLEELAVDIPQDFNLLAKAFWPGPLTIILKRHPNVPASVSAGLDTIAVRMPSHPVARKLLLKVGEPLVAPSANLSGKPSSTAAEHVNEDFKNSVAILDGGESPIGIESTVICLVCGKEPLLLRPGTITKEEIEAVLKKQVRLFSKKRASNEILPSPGLMHRHYAPAAQMKLFMDWQSLVHYAATSKQKMLLLESVTEETLYSLLRRADREKYKEILVFCDEKMCKNLALMDRLNRAALIN